MRKGLRLGKYRLERHLGSGAFADVWSARDTVENRVVALKITSKEVVEQHGRAAIEREARIAANLSHPNIVGTRNADWLDGRFLIATDLARINLASYAGARRSANVALRVIGDVVSGLAYAHERRLMHRDLKPENILIFADGRAALADFGTSVFAKAGTITMTEVGTLGYMAPEQAYGRPSLSSDVFSVGVIAYDLLSGKLLSWPFDWPPRGYPRFQSRVPEPLHPVIRKACEFNPRKRYRNGVEFLNAWDAAMRKIERNRTPKPRKSRKQIEPPTPLEVQARLFRKRHGARLGMKFECHHCEGPIAETMSFCPWCGSSENSFREITRFPLVCPSCERGVKAEWKACPWCYAGRFEGNGREPRFDPLAERNCTRRDCDGQLRKFMRYCPLCKQKPRRVWSDAELSDRCPRCRWSVSREFWHFCPWCGRKEKR